MPGGDRTGPAGMGPMTGRAAGYCAGYPAPGFMNPVGGRGAWGSGMRGGGRGWRNWYYATGLPGWSRAGMGLPAFGTMPYAPSGAGVAPSPYGVPSVGAPTREQELDFLKGQTEYLEDALEGIRKRMQELEAKAKKS